MKSVSSRGRARLFAEALREFCSGKLACYKIPRYVRIVDDYPMTVTGKVRKAQMREESVASLAVPAPAQAWQLAIDITLTPQVCRRNKVNPGVHHALTQ